MSKVASADVVIFGGGVAGLWLLNRLRQSGFSVLLFESASLGGGQTDKSQGIIHGGMKYALHGKLTKEAEQMASLPERWKSCLAGDGEINLSGVPVLSTQQFLWASQKLASKFAGFLAGAALSSKVSSVKKEAYPAVFQHTAFKGEVFALDEMVIDVPALVRELVKSNQDVIFKIEPLCGDELKFGDEGALESATVYLAGKAMEIVAQQFVFAAGSGNEVILNQLKQDNIAMQRRPLHMVLVKMPFDYALYAHCLGLSQRPRITITTHHTQAGETIWYLGGMLAEEGVTRSQEEQIQAARVELKALFPWLDFSAALFSSFRIDRAEPLQPGFLKPESTYSKHIENMTIAWPTKLALAPQLAEEILQSFHEVGLTPQRCDTRELRSWPMPPFAQPIWETAFCKNSA
ncbi:MAG TPA: FAD-dependent oxidoreductase [Gammaproteobacteria bacterium]|jgi:glycerol-3-phosphate dehydrogenase|nr:FAD-dependent oxidoreductase [Gammaproteobacteria bacterium]